jgi:hypothetical protein
MAARPPPYHILADMLRQSSLAADAGALVPAIAMLYIAIDTLAWLSLPAGQNRHTRRHFIDWVDTYLRTPGQQPYEYLGRDMYAARCAVLHKMGSLAELHRENPAPRKFGYTDIRDHQTDSGNLVLISIARLTADLGASIQKFGQALRADPDLRARVEPRLKELLQIAPIPHGDDRPAAIA